MFERVQFVYQIRLASFGITVSLERIYTDENIFIEFIDSDTNNSVQKTLNTERIENRMILIS